MAKTTGTKAPVKLDPKAAEPPVMGAGADEQNAAQGRGDPPANPADATPEAKGEGSTANSTASADEGSRDDKGHFTGNPPSLEEKVDALIDLLEANGMSLGHTLSHGRG